jgi:hypothetical protein
LVEDEEAGQKGIKEENFELKATTPEQQINFFP